MALEHGELVLQQQDLGGAPSRIPARKPDRSEHAGGKEKDETQTHKPRSSLIDHAPRNLMTSMDVLIGTFRL